MTLKKVIILIVSMTLAVTAVMIAMTLLKKPVNGAEEVAKKYVRAYLAEDYIEMDKYSVSSQEKIKAEELKFYMEQGSTEEEYWEQVKIDYEIDTIPKDYNDFVAIIKKTQAQYLEDTFGKDYSISLEVLESKSATGDEIDKFLKGMESSGLILNDYELSDISEVCAITIELTAAGELMQADVKQKYDVLTVKLGENFKVLYING